nr:uncharacterized protein LOC111984909 [Quercus suber]
MPLQQYPRHANADARRQESTQTQYGSTHADAAIITQDDKSLSCRRRPREPHLAAAATGCSSLHRLSDRLISLSLEPSSLSRARFQARKCPVPNQAALSPLMCSFKV